MFESRNVIIHLSRGALGFAALSASVVWGEREPWLLLLSLPLALFALRGCPLCWTLGLVETLANKVRGRKTESACLDGRCAR
jgi:hypothetical protein